MKKSILITVGLSALISQSATAVTIASDTFSYPDGSLVPNGGWENHSGTAGDLLVTNEQAVVQHGVPSEDANLLFAVQTTGILTATFDIVVTDDAVIGGTDFEYFANFLTRGSFNFRSRVDVQAPTTGGDYTLGISSSASLADATLAQDFQFGATIGISMTFDFDTGTGTLTAGGETISGLDSGAGQSLDAFALRQSDSSNNETITVDNLVIDGAIPEPSIALLGGLGLLGLIRRRR